MSYTFHHLTHPTMRDWSQLRAIYNHTFAREFRHPLSAVKRDVRTGARLLYVGRRHESPRAPIVSFVILACLPGTTSVYGEYIGTDPAYQNQGIGWQLFGFMIVHLKTLPGIDALVVDAEAPATDAPPDDINRRRLRYHERLGLRPIPSMAHYRVPLLPKMMVPMCLLWMPLDDRATSPDVSEIGGWVRGICTINGYGEAFAGQLIDEMNAAR